MADRYNSLALQPPYQINNNGAFCYMNSRLLIELHIFSQHMMDNQVVCQGSVKHYTLVGSSC